MSINRDLEQSSSKSLWQSHHQPKQRWRREEKKMKRNKINYLLKSLLLHLNEINIKIFRLDNKSRNPQHTTNLLQHFIDHFQRRVIITFTTGNSNAIEYLIMIWYWCKTADIRYHWDPYSFYLQHFLFYFFFFSSLAKFFSLHSKPPTEL